MSRLIVKLVKVKLLAITVVVVVVIVGMRTKREPVLSGMRRVNRAFWNPMAMKTAGTPGAYASVIRHVGRTSGRAYATPVTAVPTDDGFVIATPYGAESDWAQNVLASGSATIEHEGATYEVARPEIVAMEQVESWFGGGDQRAHRLFGVSECLRVANAVANA
jgi:deazaflavin-dependent oxidoreductase (nitroreductase family)